MKKNILFVIDSLSSGGAEKSLISLLNLFDYSKYSVDLLMFSPKGLYLSLLPEQVNILEELKFLQEQSKGIKHLIINRNLKGLYLRVRASLDIRNIYLNKKYHGAQITWKWISKGIENIAKKYDVAIAYSQGMPTYYVADKVVAKTKLCWINTDYKKAKYDENFDIKYYKKFDNIVTVSEYGKKSFIDKMPSMLDKVKVIYDIISPTLIKKMSNENCNFDDDYEGVKILTIGRLVELKGYDMAIEAAYKLKEQGIDFRWYSIGKGNLKSKLITMIKKYELEDKFIFLGETTNPYTYLNNIDIYVQPSRFEGFGLAIAEARILNKPVVTTRFDAVYNQIINGKNGLVVDMNWQAISDGIEKLIKDTKLKEDIIEYLKHEKKGNEEEIYKFYDLIEG